MIYVVAVDPAMTGGWAVVEHHDDGRRRLMTSGWWEQARGPDGPRGGEGKPLRWDGGGLAGAIGALDDAPSFHGDTIVRVEAAWRGRRGEASAIPAALAAGIWLTRACPSWAYEVVTAQAWRAYHRLPQRGSDEELKRASMVLAAELTGHESETHDEAEAILIAWMPVEEGA